mmetsp:Transcript_16338/g.28633  ORF Transcript_16338/g.28633 Transcript_16338/m.28633 type:complete len:239 (-) Transcript_16338:191-907(-)
MTSSPSLTRTSRKYPKSLSNSLPGSCATTFEPAIAFSIRALSSGLRGVPLAMLSVSWSAGASGLPKMEKAFPRPKATFAPSTAAGASGPKELPQPSVTAEHSALAPALIGQFSGGLEPSAAYDFKAFTSVPASPSFPPKAVKIPARMRAPMIGAMIGYGSSSRSSSNDLMVISKMTTANPVERPIKVLVMRTSGPSGPSNLNALRAENPLPRLRVIKTAAAAPARHPRAERSQLRLLA